MVQSLLDSSEDREGEFATDVSFGLPARISNRFQGRLIPCVTDRPGTPSTTVCVGVHAWCVCLWQIIWVLWWNFVRVIPITDKRGDSSLVCPVTVHLLRAHM